MLPKRLFLIERHPDIGETLADLFASEGYNVTRSADVNTLLHRSDFADVDLILADTGSDCDLNGKLASRRKRGEISVPILVIACYCVYDKEAYFMRMGLDAVHAKPLDLNLLVQQVNHLAQPLSSVP